MVLPPNLPIAIPERNPNRIVFEEDSVEELIEEVILPDENAALAPEMERCLAQKKIYWPADSQCYTLLTQGPCNSGQWLVASKIQPRYNWQKPQIKVHCKTKTCPCLASDPDFCEVEMKENGGNCRNCVTALAAEQDGICGQGEQLFNSPFGYGICGCRTKPHLHVPWNEDGKCYPLLGKGPCRENETLHWSQRRERPICVPRVCPEGLVLSALDGRCHFMHTQGPCTDPEDVYKIDERTKELRCMPRNNFRIKRIFDVLPSKLRESQIGEVHEASMSNCLNGGLHCNGHRGGHHRLSTINDPRMGKRTGQRGQAKAFILWLRSFL